MQIALQEAQSTNEMLSLQLEERTQDVEMLESRLNAQLSLSSDMFSVSNTANSRSLQTSNKDSTPQPEYEEALEELAETKRELEKNAATLAEQLISIGKMEAVLASSAETIENLETEKARLTQKLALMQRIKSDYDTQSSLLEKTQARVLELQTQLAEQAPANTGQIEMLETQNSALIGQLSALQSIQEEHRAQGNTIASLKRTIENLTTDLEEERQFKIELQRQNQFLQSQSEVAKVAEDGNEAGYHARIDQLESSLVALVQQKEAMTKELVELRFIKEDYEEEMMNRQGIEARMSEMDKQWSLLEDSIRQKEAEIERLESELDDMQSKFQLEIKLLKEEQDNLMMERDELLDLVEEQKQSLVDVHERGAVSPPVPPKDTLVTQEQDEVAALVAKLDAAEVELEELKLQLAQQNQVRDTVDPVSPDDKSMVNEHYILAQHSQEIQQLQQQLQGYEDQAQELRSQLRDIQVERDQFYSDLQIIAEEKAQLENDLHYQVQELDQMSKMLHEMEEQQSGDDDHYSKRKHDEEMSSMQSKMNELVVSIDHLKEEIAQFELERSEWTEREKETTDLELAYQDALAEKQNKINLLEKEFKNAMDLVQELEQSRNSLSPIDPSVVAQLELRLEEHRILCTKQESHIKQLEVSLAEAKERCANLEKQLNDSYATIEALRNEADQKESVIQELRREVKAIQEGALHNEDLENEIHLRDTKLAELQFEMSAKLGHQASLVTELESLLSQKDGRIQELEQRVNSNDLKGFQERVDQQRLEIQRKSQEMASLQAKFDEEQSRIAALESELAIARKSVGHLDESTQAANTLLEQVKEYERQVKTLESQLASKEAEMEQISQMISDLQAELGDASKQIDDLEAVNAELEDKLDYHQGISEDALKQVDEYEEEILKLRQSSQISEIQNELNGTSRIQELEDMNDQLLDKIATLSEKLAKQDMNRVSMTPQLATQFSQQEKLEGQVKELMSRLQAVQSEKMVLLDQLEDLKDHNSMLQQSLQSLKK
jgi:chromosome segregation protein